MVSYIGADTHQEWEYLDVFMSDFIYQGFLFWESMMRNEDVMVPAQRLATAQNG